jgi:hypothetical protein
MAQSHAPKVREWLTSLGILSAVSMSRQEAELKLAAFVPLLMREYPDAAFTSDSLAHVARQCQYFPTYYEVCQHLGAWWRDHKPLPPALPAPDPLPPRPQKSPEELEYIHRLVEGLAALLRPTSAKEWLDDPPPGSVEEQIALLNPPPDARRLKPRPSYLTRSQLIMAYRYQVVHGATPNAQDAARTRLLNLEADAPNGWERDPKETANA